MSKKTFQLDVDKEYKFKKPLHGTSPTSVRAALKWVEDHAGEDEEGNVEVPDVEWVIIYAVRRMVALHKDEKRYDSGKLAERRYAPRIDNVEKAPRKLHIAVEEVHSTQEKKPEAKPKAPKRVKAKDRKPGEKPAPPPGDVGNATVADTL